MIKTVIIGLDAFDPDMFEAFSEKGKLPNLTRLSKRGGYSRFKVTDPPQSEVSWTSIATGLNPGEHGMFDFVHRDPATYGLQVSLLPVRKSIGGTQFVRPYNARTIFDMAADQGYPSTSLWWPATFPARPESPVRTIPGLGVPDIQGRMGVGAFYTTDEPQTEKQGKTPLFKLQSTGGNNFSSTFKGLIVKQGDRVRSIEVPFVLKIVDDHSAQLSFQKKSIRLQTGNWSPILEIVFKPSWAASVRAITRVILVRASPVIELYVLPFQIHPIRPLWRYGTPASFVRDAWQNSGPFLTLGWPQDTTGLEDNCINDEQFLVLCDTIFDARSKLLFHLLDSFTEGLLASVFDSLDRIQHMFLRRRPDIIEKWYTRYDQLVGEVQQRLDNLSGQPARLIVVSDHGFKPFDYKIHLNRWLIDKGYIQTRPDKHSDDLKSVDWSSTKAYAVGLNSLYLNQVGRESNGVVQSAEIDSIRNLIKDELRTWSLPDGTPIVTNVKMNEEVFNGPASASGPDLLIGYSAGFRASGETGLGAWKSNAVENNCDHWEADHCYDSSHVPGVLFSSAGLKAFPNPSYKDFPELAIDLPPDIDSTKPPPVYSVDDQERVEERLKSLGYL